MDVDHARSLLAQAARVLSRLGYIDLMGHVSMRLDAETIAVSPGFGPEVPPPALLSPTDILLAHKSGRIMGGAYDPPLELPLHFAIYDQNQSAGAIIVGSPPTSIAFGIAGRSLVPVAHSQAWLAYQGAPMIDLIGLPTDIARAGALSTLIGEHPVAHLRGVATVFVGSDLTAVMRSCDSYEYLARLNTLTTQLGGEPRVVSFEEASAIHETRSGGETIPSRDPYRYFASFDREPPQFVEPADPHSLAGAKEQVALSCRILASRGSLVAFFEHVSQRLPDGETFLMSPAKNFAQMEPDDIGTISLDDDCSWLTGPYPPAPFRRYHRDILRARHDVSSIVHTHEMYGRALAMANATLTPVFRNGTALCRPIPTFERPTMAFSDDDRRTAVELLGSDSIVQLLSHGTDFLAATLEEATVAAVHREEAAQAFHLASQLGEPQVLGDAVIEELQALGPSAKDWWRFYASAVMT